MTKLGATLLNKDRKVSFKNGIFNGNMIHDTTWTARWVGTLMHREKTAER